MRSLPYLGCHYFQGISFWESPSSASTLLLPLLQSLRSCLNRNTTCSAHNYSWVTERVSKHLPAQSNYYRCWIFSSLAYSLNTQPDPQLRHQWSYYCPRRACGDAHEFSEHHRSSLYSHPLFCFHQDPLSRYSISNIRFYRIFGNRYSCYNLCRFFEISRWSTFFKLFETYP